MDNNNWWEKNDSDHEQSEDKEIFERIFEGSWQLMTDEAKEGYQTQVQRRHTFKASAKKPESPRDLASTGLKEKTQVESKVVGGAAPKLDEDNIGNKMLRSMGWNPGEGLGRERSGRTSPVQAVCRPKLRGLGHESK